MLNWILENWLALLGAVTGTLALLVSYLSYRHAKSKEEINLVVSCMAHSQQAENLSKFAETEEAEPWNRQAMVEIYTVIVRNRGCVAAPLSRVGVVSDSDEEHTAFIMNGQFMEEVTGENISYLQPKSEREFNIYLKRGEEFYSISKAFVIDQTGKRWEVNA